MPQLMEGTSVENLGCDFMTNKESTITLKGRARPILKEGSFDGSQAFSLM